MQWLRCFRPRPGSEPREEAVAPLSPRTRTCGSGGSRRHNGAGGLVGHDLHQLGNILRALAMIRGTPLEQLNRGVDRLVHLLNVSTASVAAVSTTGTSYMVVASNGVGKETSEVGMPKLVTRVAGQPEYSMQDVILKQEPVMLHARSKAALFADWELLHRQHGLVCFAAVPITKGSELLGVLEVADVKEDVVQQPGFIAMLEAISVWLAQWLQDAHVPKVVQLLQELALADSLGSFVRSVADGLVDLYRHKLHLHLNCRLALVSPDVTAAVIFEQLLMSVASSPANGTDNGEPDSTKPPGPRRPSEQVSKVRRARSSVMSMMSISSLDDYRCLISGMGKHAASKQGHAHDSSASRLSQLYQSAVAVEGSAQPHSPPGTPSMHTARRGSDAMPSAAAALELVRSGGAKNLDELNEDIIWQLLCDNQATSSRGHYHGHSIALPHTLLGRVLQQESGTWICDCTSYLQSTKPVKDLVLSSRSRPVSSLVVAATSTSSGGPVVGCYLTSATALNVYTLQVLLKDLQTLLVLLQPLVSHKLTGNLADHWRGVCEALQLLLQDNAPPGGVFRLQRSLHKTETTKSDNTQVTTASENMLLQPLPAATCDMGDAIQVSRVQDRQLLPFICGLQDKLRALYFTNLQHNIIFNRPEDLGTLRVTEQIAAGGHGTVYKGLLTGLEIAVKVIPTPLDSGALDSGPLREAMELAVMSTVSHPNMLQVLTFFTDVMVSDTHPNEMQQQGLMRFTLAKEHEASSTVPLQVAGARYSAPQQMVSSAGGCSFGEISGAGQGLDQASSLARRSFSCHRVLSSSGGGNGNCNLPLSGRSKSCLGPAGAPPSPGQALRHAYSHGHEAAMMRQQAQQQVMQHLGISPLGPQATMSLLCQQQVQLPKASQRSGPVTRCLVICMELCDQGSLEDAISKGAFREPIQGCYGAQRPNFTSIYKTLLEVALALRHMHSLQLVHCDVKPSNVLLCSSLTDSRRFTARLSDFGLVKVLLDQVDTTEDLRRANVGGIHGTVTHLPPEVLSGASPLDYSSDVYAMGIMMWEMVMAAPLYIGLDNRAVAQGVVHNHLRPEFPSWINPEYRELAESCWALDPQARPTMDELVQALCSLLSAAREVDMTSGRLSNTCSLVQARSTAVAVHEASHISQSMDEFPMFIL